VFQFPALVTAQDIPIATAIQDTQEQFPGFQVVGHIWELVNLVPLEHTPTEQAPASKLRVLQKRMVDLSASVSMDSAGLSNSIEHQVFTSQIATCAAQGQRQIILAVVKVYRAQLIPSPIQAVNVSLVLLVLLAGITDTNCTMELALM